MSSGFNDGAMKLIIIGIGFLWGSILIMVGTKNPKSFVNKREVMIFREILGKKNTITVFKFIGRFSLYASIGIFILAIYSFLFE